MVESRFHIIAEPAKCVGCTLCQLRCSYRFTKTFRPSQAKIRIDWSESARGYQVAFTEECDSCGLCARYCVYGALTAQEPARGGSDGPKT